MWAPILEVSIGWHGRGPPFAGSIIDFNERRNEAGKENTT